MCIVALPQRDVSRALLFGGPTGVRDVPPTSPLPLFSSTSRREIRLPYKAECGANLEAKSAPRFEAMVRNRNDNNLLRPPALT